MHAPAVLPDPLSLPPVPPPAPDDQPLRDRLLLGLLALLLVLPGLALVFTASRSTTLFENRAAAPWPGVPSARFATEFERAFADRFGGRDALIALHHTIKLAVFGQPPVDKVLPGRAGWLFYTGDDGLDLQRRRLADEASVAAQARQIVAALQRRVDHLDGRGVAWLLVVVPDKQTLYPEHLPAVYRLEGRTTLLDAVLAAAPPELRQRIVDLRPVLRQARQQQRDVFYRTDSHWNDTGSWLGHLEVLAALRRARGLPPLPAAPLPDVVEDGEMHGDLQQMLGVRLGPAERAQRLVRPAGWLECAVNDAGQPADWNARRQTLRCPGAEGGKVALFHDSMGVGLRHFLPHRLQESQWIWQRAWDLPAIEAMAPQAVIDEVVERNLDRLIDTSFLAAAPAVAGAAGPAIAAAPPVAPPSPAPTPAWQAGAPTAVAPDAPGTGSCSLDLVDARPAEQAPPLTPDQPLVFEGWAARADRALLPHRAWLVLQDQRQKRVHLELQLRLPRPDVAAFTGQAALAQAGYRLSARVPALPAGNYAAWVAWTDAEGALVCDTRRALRLAAAPR